jgi:CRISPR-associated endonuclease/helicase Cas3
LVDRVSRPGRDSSASIRYASLILPASFGGIERGQGLLDDDAPKQPEDATGDDAQMKAEKAQQRLAVPDVADVAQARPRRREVIDVTEDGPSEPRTIGAGIKLPNPLRFSLALDSDDDRVTRLVSLVPRREKPEFGTGQAEILAAHVGKVRAAMDSILERLELPDHVQQAARLAAEFHDHGKNRERWQHGACGTATSGTTTWLQQMALEGDGKLQCLGKSARPLKRDPRGYRHEFGSLREFADSMMDKASEVFDLAMHLIATHHGRGRPHFAKGGFDPDCERRSDEIHTEAIRRFARLQRKYGWWHLAWLENLLRCADALASADQESEDDPTDWEGIKP